MERPRPSSLVHGPTDTASMYPPHDLEAPITSTEKTSADGEAEIRLACCGLELVMNRRERRLFLYKTVFVFVLTFSLLPLIRLKSDIPKTIFTVGLVVLHVFILIVYLYKVNYRRLDPDWRAAIARVLALAFSIGLLMLVARNDSRAKSIAFVAGIMLAMCMVHVIVLLLLMVRVQYSNPKREPLLNDQPNTKNYSGTDVQTTTEASAEA